MCNSLHVWCRDSPTALLPCPWPPSTLSSQLPVPLGPSLLQMFSYYEPERAD